MKKFTPIETKEEFAEKTFKPDPQEKYRKSSCTKSWLTQLERETSLHSTTEDKINFRTGVLDLSGGLFREHSADFGFRGVLPYGYDPSATCPTFEWWLSDVMLGDTELIKILQEYMGYVVRGGEYTFHKAL